MNSINRLLKGLREHGGPTPSPAFRFIRRAIGAIYRRYL